MYRKHKNVHEFKNGNMSIKFDRDILQNIHDQKTSDIEEISYILEELDTYFIGEEFCISNYAMGINLYNCHSNLMYIFNFSDIENVLMTGKWLKLYALKIDDDYRELLRMEGFE